MTGCHHLKLNLNKEKITENWIVRMTLIYLLRQTANCVITWRLAEEMRRWWCRGWERWQCRQWQGSPDSRCQDSCQPPSGTRGTRYTLSGLTDCLCWLSSLKSKVNVNWHSESLFRFCELVDNAVTVDVYILSIQNNVTTKRFSPLICKYSNLFTLAR